MKKIDKRSDRIVVNWRFLKKNGEYGVWHWRYARMQNKLAGILKAVQKGHCVGELRVNYRKGIENEAKFNNEDELRLALSAFLEQSLVDYLSI